MTSKKEAEANRPISTLGDKASKLQDANSGTAIASAYPSLPPTPKIPQPKIDATDRRQVDAHNEDKAHTTKEELDDIKRTHYKEKKKREQNNMEPGPSGLNLERWVSKTLIL